MKYGAVRKFSLSRFSGDSPFEITGQSKAVAETKSVSFFRLGNAKQKKDVQEKNARAARSK